ncbi:MAG: deoxyribodipyrimidine photo-lyase [Halobacteriales archaeon]|nr:deoxyribodipyrimidine photo-lyase [Halobacteriales archaeon]
MLLFWHRRDLRVADNRGLAAAADRDTVVPVFVFDPVVLEHASPPRVAFMLDALEQLRAAYRDRDSDLLTVRGNPTDRLPEVAAAHDADGVLYNEDYSGLARRRDAAVEEALAAEGIDAEAFEDQLLHEPGSITTNEGTHYSVFTYFWRKWRDRPKPDSVPAPSADAFAGCSGSPLPTNEDLGFDAPSATIPAAGTQPARARLASFCDGPIYDYEDRRDDPAADGTSRLSAQLKWGTIGIREVYERTAAAHEQAPDEAARESVEEFQSQLAWREFYTHVLRFNPSVVTENFKSYENPIEWHDDPEALEAWQDGETGYPIVDAGMRQLREEAWMHNRVRMIVASFLTKDLLLDWRAGYDWFRRRLVDHDTANDNGGWQWAASTGTDAQPYFRIFNPMTQGERYDPDAEYIKTYVPELEGVPADAIHSWNELAVDRRRDLAPAYPDPIVDHAERREAALAMFEAARGDA